MSGSLKDGENRRTHPRSPGKRRLKRIAFFTASGLILLFAVGSWIVHSRGFRSWLLTRLDQSLQEQAGMTLSVGRLKLRPFALAAEMEGVRIQARPGLSGLVKEAVAERIEIDLGSATLLGSRYHIQSLRIVNPRFEFFRTAPSPSATPERKGSAGGPPIRWRIDRFRMENGEIEYKDGSRRIAADLSGVTAGMSFAADRARHIGEIRSGTGNLRIAERNFPIRSLRADLEADNDSIHFKALSIESEPLEMSLRGRILSYQTLPLVEIETEGKIHLSALRDLVAGDRPLSGRMDFSGSLKGPAGSPEGILTFSGGPLMVAGFPLDSVRAEIAGDAAGLELRALSLEGAGGRLNGRGRFDTEEDGPMSVSLDWTGLDIRRLTSRLGGRPIGVSTRSRGHLSIHSQGLDPDTAGIEGRVEFQPVERDEAGPGSPLPITGSLDIRSRNGGLTVESRDLKLADHRFSISAEFDRNRIRQARFSMLSDALSRLPRQIEALLGPTSPMEALSPFAARLGGRILLSGSARGSWNSPEVYLSLKDRALSFNGAESIPLEGEFLIDGSGLEVKNLIIGRPDEGLRLGGRVGYDSDRRNWGETWSLHAQARNIDIFPLSSAWSSRTAPKGRLNGTLAGSGAFLDPDISFFLEIREGMFAGETVDSLSLDGRWEGNRLDVRRLDMVKGSSRLGGNFSLGLDERDYRVRLSSEDIALGDLNFLKSEGTAPEGRVRFRLEGEGRLNHPRFRLETEGRDIRINRAAWPNIRLEAESDGRIIQARFRLPDRKAELSARMDWSGPGIVQGRLTTDALDILSWLPAASTPVPELSLTSTLDFTLPLRDREAISGTWNISEASLRHHDRVLRTMGPFQLGWSNRELSLSDLRIEGPAFRLTASGRIPLENPASTGIRIRADADVSRLSFLFPGWRPTGNIQIEGIASGSIAEPDLDIRIELQNGGLETESSPLSIRDAGMRAFLRGDRIELDDLALASMGGRISASGSLPLRALLGETPAVREREIPPMDVTVRLDGLDPALLLPLPDPDTARGLFSRVSGSFHIGGTADRFDNMIIEGVLSRLEFFSAGVSLANPRDVPIEMRDGRLRIDSFRLQGSGSEVMLRAEMGIAPPSPIDAELNARIEAAVFNPLLENLTVGGRVELALQGSGSLNSPIITGEAAVAGGSLEFSEFPLAVTEITGRLDMTPDGLTASDWTGMANGGPLRFSGGLRHENFRILSGMAEGRFEEVQVETPEGIQGIAGGSLEWSGRPPEWLVSGSIRLNQGYFGRTIHPGGELFGLIGRPMVTPPEPSPLVRDIRLDIQLETGDDLVVDNNLAEVEMGGNLRLAGTVGRPLLTGRVANRNPGEVTFGGRLFEIENAAVDYSGVPPTDGRLNLTAHTRMSHQYDELNITLTLTGPLTHLEYDLSSEPPRSQGELASLLITGYGTEKLKNDTANVIGGQMILFFTSPLASPVTERIRGLLGAEEVSLEPINIASEEDPGARFTFRKGLIRNVDLVYSIDIGNTQEQAWLLEYNLSRNFSLSTFRRDDGSSGASLGIRFSLGGRGLFKKDPASGRGRPPRVEQVEFRGTSPIPRSRLQKAVRPLRRGVFFHYTDLRKAVDRLESLHKREGWLGAVVDSRIERKGKQGMDVVFELAPGPPVSLRLIGLERGGKLEKELIETWNGRVPPEISLANARERVRGHLIGRGFYEAEVEARSEDVDKSDTVYRIEVRRGPRYRIRNLDLPPESPVTSREIRRALRLIPDSGKRGFWLFLTRFSQASAQIRELLAGKGYRRPVLSRPRISIDRTASALDLFLPLRAGPLSRVSAVLFEQASPIPESELINGQALSPGSLYTPGRMMDDRNRLDRIFRSRGFQDVRIFPEIRPLPDSPDVAVVWRIEPGERHVISDIRISGHRRTAESMIRRQLLFKAGDALDLEKLMVSQKRLYELGVFRSVNVRRDRSMEPGPRAPVLVELEETPLLTLGGGLRYDSEEKLEGFGQADINNIFGRGGKGLFFFKQNQRQKNLRLSFSTPYLLGRRIETLHSLSYLEEVESVFKSEELSYSIQQRIRLPLRFSLSYLYRFNRIHTFELVPSGPFPFDITLNLSELQSFLIRDTRDDKLNARRGSFLSFSLTWSPDFLGSDLTFIRFFAQSSFYIDLGRNVIWASNYRIGLADAFDQVLIPSRRFFAGGGNSLRGFERDILGPYNTFFEEADGGEGMLLINQELRFPIWRRLGGVIFFDCGNIYAQGRDFDLRDLRYSAGGGIRLNTPIALFRLDYGINLDPRPWEKRGGILFFSLGHSF